MAKRLAENSLPRVSEAVRFFERMKHDETIGASPRQTPIPFQFRRYELKGDLEPFGSAEAWILRYNGTEYAIDPADLSDANGGTAGLVDKTFTVHDFAGVSGTGRTMGESPDYEIVDGDRGLCWHPHDVDRWEPILPNRRPATQATMIEGHLTDDITKTDSTFEIDDISVMQPIDGALDVAGAANGTMTIANREFDGDKYASCVAAWFPSEPTWRAIDIPCPK